MARGVKESGFSCYLYSRFMKKAILTISLFAYLLLTSGIVVNFHYCMDRLASTQLFAPEQKRCDKCGMHKDSSNGCCRDEIVVVKMSEDQNNLSDISFSLASLEPLQQSATSFINAAFVNVEQVRHYKNHSPPLLSEQDTHLRNSVFRI
jgi:hypothetical protein